MFMLNATFKFLTGVIEQHGHFWRIITVMKKFFSRVLNSTEVLKRLC